MVIVNSVVIFSFMATILFVNGHQDGHDSTTIVTIHSKDPICVHSCPSGSDHSQSGCKNCGSTSINQPEPTVYHGTSSVSHSGATTYQGPSYVQSASSYPVSTNQLSNSIPINTVSQSSCPNYVYPVNCGASGGAPVNGGFQVNGGRDGDLLVPHSVSYTTCVDGDVVSYTYSLQPNSGNKQCNCRCSAHNHY